MALLISEDDVRAALSFPAAIEAVEQVFRELADPAVINMPRQRSVSGSATFNVMWALSPAQGVMGVKTYPVVRSDVTVGAAFVLTLYDFRTGKLLAVVEADTLGQRRTGAASAVATRAMARADSRTLAVFGAGWQAESQVEAIVTAVPTIEQVLVVGRDHARADRFAAWATERTRVPAERTTAREAVSRADVVVTATGATEPVFDGDDLRPGTHINAVGSNYVAKRELDARALERAAVVAADSIDVARADSGDLWRNDFDWNRLVSMTAVLTGEAPGRSDEDEITVFESHGLALQDVACARHAWEVLEQQGGGAVWPAG